MRSDHLERHSKVHTDLLSLTDERVIEELKLRQTVQMEREERRQKIEEIARKEGIPTPMEIATTEREEDLREDILRDNQYYLEKVELGKKIDAILSEGIVYEESLSKERKQALDLYRKQRPRFDEILNVKLRPWQEQALQLIETPTERKVIWMVGRRGNEGKSWFQCYIEAYYGFHRVVRIDLRMKHADVCQVLKKRNLASINVFLFNDSRSVSGEELNLYRILEDIKDGQATTSKYDNDNIRFKTPNTLMVFSNVYPNTKKLSRDRWDIYNVNKNGLNNVTQQIMKMRKDGRNMGYDCR